MTVVVVVVVALGVLAFGLFVVAMLVLTSVRRRKDWAGASLVLSADEPAAVEDEDPANLGAAAPGYDGGAEAHGRS